MADHLNLKLWLLSPLHIGSGVDLSWLDATIDPQNRVLVRFDPTRLPPRSKLGLKISTLAAQALELSPQGDPTRLLNIIATFQQRLKGSRLVLADAEVAALAIMPKLATHLGSRLGLTGGSKSDVAQDVNNPTIDALAIAEIARDGRRGTPAIPGSTIKGALRTSWLDKLAAGNREAGELAQGKAQDYERKILGGSFEEDPFSHLAVQDFLAPDTLGSAILYTFTKYRDAEMGEAKSPTRVVAALPSAEPANGTLRHVRRNKTSPEVGFHDLLRACHDFHLGLWNAHLKQMRHHAPEWWISKMIETVRMIAPERGSALIRLGKFCTAEAKTTRHRSISVNVKQGDTFKLAGDYRDTKGVPFGWAVLGWGDGVAPGRSVIDGFREHAPWSKLKIAPRRQRWAPSPETPTVRPEELYDSEGARSVAKMQQMLERGQLSVEYVKSEIRQATHWSPEDRASFANWVKEHIARIEPKAFKRQFILDALKKLA